MRNKIINTFLVFIILSCTFITIIISYGRIEVAHASATNDLLGYKVYIDPGHGGWDNGASDNGVLEDEINLSLSLSIIEHLIDRGAIVEISRVGDYDLASLYASNRKREDLLKRMEAIRSFHPDIFISIHINSYPSENVSGAQVFHQIRKEKSMALAQALQGQLNDLNKTDKEVKPGDFYLLNNLKENGVLIECGFITNSRDRKNLLSEAYRKQLAEKIADGIAHFAYAV